MPTQEELERAVRNAKAPKTRQRREAIEDRFFRVIVSQHFGWTPEIRFRGRLRNPDGPEYFYWTERFG